MWANAAMSLNLNRSSLLTSHHSATARNSTSKSHLSRSLCSSTLARKMEMLKLCDSRWNANNFNSLYELNSPRHWNNLSVQYWPKHPLEYSGVPASQIISGFWSVARRKNWREESGNLTICHQKGKFFGSNDQELERFTSPLYEYAYLGKYDFPSEFDQTLNKKESKKHKIDFKLRKNTYLEQIQS